MTILSMTNGRSAREKRRGKKNKTEATTHSMMWYFNTYASMYMYTYMYICIHIYIYTCVVYVCIYIILIIIIYIYMHIYL